MRGKSQTRVQSGRNRWKGRPSQGRSPEKVGAIGTRPPWVRDASPCRAKYGTRGLKTRCRAAQLFGSLCRQSELHSNEPLLQPFPPSDLAPVSLLPPPPRIFLLSVGNRSFKAASRVPPLCSNFPASDSDKLTQAPRCPLSPPRVTRTKLGGRNLCLFNSCPAPDAIMTKVAADFEKIINQGMPLHQPFRHCRLLTKDYTRRQRAQEE